MRKSTLKPPPARADNVTMRTTILGTIGVVWGGAIIASGILDNRMSAGPAYAIGELMALAIGAALVAAGARALVRHR